MCSRKLFNPNSGERTIRRKLRNENFVNLDELLTPTDDLYDGVLLGESPTVKNLNESE